MIFTMLFQLGKNSSLDEFAALADIKQEQHLKLQGYNHLMMFSTAGAALLFQFQIEHLFENIWRALGKPHDGQYSRLANNLLQHLGLSSSRNIDKLKFLRCIRNSLHNNGVHGFDDWKFEIDVKMETNWGPINISGQQEFKRSKIVECSPIILLAAFCHALEVVVDVISSPQISCIPGPIPDLQQSS